MKAATRDKKSRWYLHKLVLSAALAGMALVFMVCQAPPTKAATMEEKLQEFLHGPPFDFTVEFQGLKPAGEVVEVEDPLPTLSLPPLAPKTGEPTLEQIREFAEIVLGEPFAFHQVPPGAGSGPTGELHPLRASSAGRRD